MPSDSEAFEGPIALQGTAKIASNVRQKPGSIAWTKDSGTIAFISDSLQLYSIRTGRISNTHISSASFLASGPDSRINLLHEQNSAPGITTLDTATMERKDIRVDHHPDGIISLPDSSKLLLITARLTQKSLWAELNYSASLLDLKTLKSDKIYQSQRVIPGKAALPDYKSAWLWPGPRPFETELFAMEYVKPPVLMPYLKIRLADYITGKIIEAGRIEHSSASVPVSWSPDGSRFAFPDRQGRLCIYSLKDSLQNCEIRAELTTGYFPAWNPKGSQIYFGGHIINSDGSSTEKVIDDGRESMGIWSPDGKMLAIADRGSLYLVRDFRPSLILPDRTYTPDFMKKRRLLKELLVDKLITDQEYEERYNNLLKTAE